MKQHRSSRKRHATQVLALAMAINIISTARLGHADPGDIFSVAAPAIGAEQPAPHPIMDGDAAVATKTGALEYSYPLTVPPGRNGMQPHLSLNYSSQAPIYGSIAAGWSLSIPIITIDTSDGRLVNPKGKIYQSSMAGNRPLVPVTEHVGPSTLQGYRGQNDGSFVRYERVDPAIGYWWRAHASSGTDYLFGQATHFLGPAGPAAGCAVSDDYAPLTEEIDSFGNAVDYYYETGAANECRLQKITWGQNTAAGIASINTVTFTYSLQAQCSPGIYVGAQTSYRSGARIVAGASELDSITATATSLGSVVHTRTTSLSYDSSASNCTAAHAAYRALASISETAVGVDSPSVTLPPLTFTYGSADVSYVDASATLPWNSPEGPASYNLGWGYRFTDGRWPTVQAMMIDMDGDGLVDRLRSSPVLDAKGHTVSCRAIWDKNLGGGSFLVRDPVPPPGVTDGYIDLPTLKWASVSITPPSLYDSGPYAGANPATGIEESCSLNYQMTAFANSKDSDGFACSSTANCPCAPSDSACINAGNAFCSTSSHYGNDCSPKHAKGPTILAYRWIDVNGDGRVDLVASVAQGGLDVYDFQLGNGYNAGGGFQVPPPEPRIFGSFPRCDVHGVSDAVGGGYTMCGNMYPWFTYLNGGKGFGLAPQKSLPTPVNKSPTPNYIQYQPGPLETTQGDSSITSRPVGQSQASMDLDGDTFADEFFGGGTAPTWSLYHGNSQGQLSSSTGSTNVPYSFALAASQSIFNYINLFDVSGAGETMNLLDVNGDGLPDRWYGAKKSSATVAFNDGLRFRDPPEVTLPVRPSVEPSSLIDPGPCSEVPGGTCWTGLPTNPFILVGYRWDTQRPFDIDTDGRSDIASSTAGLWFNQGGQFSAQSPSGSYPYGGLQRTIQVSDQFGKSGAQPYTWELRSDMLDIDGDGVPEGFNFGTGRVNPINLSIAKAQNTTPRRLLTQIDNHRGAMTSITYASSTDAVVTHDALHGLPRPQWIVKQLVSHDSLAGTNPSTTYAYKNPQYGVDDRSRYGFRGFSEVTTTQPSGSQIIERFGFDVDWSGRLVTKIVQSSASDAAGPVTIDDTKWESRTLFSGAVTTFHATVADHWTCPKNTTLGAEASCRSNDANHRRQVSIWTPLTSTTSGDIITQLLWQTTEVDSLATNVSGSNPTSDGDRRTSTGYALQADATSYRLRQMSTKKDVLVGGVWQTFAQTFRTWDPHFLVPLADGTYYAPGQYFATQRTYDFAVGNVLSRIKPVQNYGDHRATVYGYDASRLYVVSEKNELNQVETFTYEPGTGTRLSVTGPNAATCAATSCPAGTLPLERHAIRVDGIGRTIERDETFSDDGAAYTSYIAETNQYLTPDYTVSHLPSTIEHRSAIDGSSGVVARYTDDVTELDGSGRVTHKTIKALGSAMADAVTSYKYNDAGTLANVQLPDSSKNDSSSVEYDYTFDSVGRATSTRRPDSTVQQDRSGVDITYDGLTSTTSEHLGAAGGVAASTRTTKDRYDRLTRVEELAASNWAATNYGYTADDNISTIVDPEGITTTIVHDMAGRQTQIVRASGTWGYGYDYNGNIVSEVSPCTGAGCEVLYTTSIVYDDLDRVSSRLVPRRDLSDGDLALFGSGLENFTYDVGPNQVGQLSQWAAYGPNATTATNIVTPSRNAQNQQTLVNETINLAGYNGISRSFRRNYGLDGLVRDTYYYDVVGTANCPNGALSEVGYDNRGLPSQVEIVPCLYDATTPYSYINDVRNVAGLVMQRASAAGSGAIVNSKSNWTYDALGRVTSQTVVEGSTSTQVAKQALVYFGNDDISTLTHSLGTSSKLFNYGYDSRHQLTSAISTAGGYFSGSFSYGTAGRFSTANETAAVSPGSDVLPRNVSYQYAGSDPEEVTQLTNIATGTIFATYTYDSAGNESARCIGGTTSSCTGVKTEYVYDGNNRLRRALKSSNGTVQASEEYWYDNNGARQIVVKRPASGSVGELDWFIEGTEVHYDPSGSPTLAYAHVGEAMPEARLTRTASAPLPSMEYQYHGLGDDTLAAVDQATGVVNTSFLYAPFGEVIEATNGGGTNSGIATHNRRFNDKIIDEVSNLTYYGVRYYDRYAMVWTQADPEYRFSPHSAWTDPRRALLYTSDLQNPLRYKDPDGRSGVAGVAADAAPALPGIGALLESIGLGALAEVALPVVAAAGLATGLVGLSAGQRDAQSMENQRLIDATNWLNSNAYQPTVDLEISAPADEPQVKSTNTERVKETGSAQDKSDRKNVIYVVPGTATDSGKDYVGRAKDLDARAKDKSDGRDRTKAKIVCHYCPEKTGDARKKEQAQIDKRGGPGGKPGQKGKLDNKRNEIAKKKKIE